MRRAAGLILAATLLAAPAWAVTPDEQLADPRLEARAVKISQNLRCVVCQNQTIDDSDAPLAHDLRILLRERLRAGDTDRQAMDFIVARYGHYVLLRPPLEADTLFLWFGPLLVLLLGGGGAALYFRSRGATAPVFSAEEQAELDRLLTPSDPV